MAEHEIRIGNAEREAAIKALDEHLAAGRLDVEEYGDRYAKASLARTQSELTPLFADLPPLRPAQPTRKPRVGSARYQLGWLLGLLPVLALGLFFLTGFFVWFLVIPLGMRLLGGPRRGHGRAGWCGPA